MRFNIVLFFTETKNKEKTRLMSYTTYMLGGLGQVRNLSGPQLLHLHRAGDTHLTGFCEKINDFRYIKS